MAPWGSIAQTQHVLSGWLRHYLRYLPERGIATIAQGVLGDSQPSARRDTRLRPSSVSSSVFSSGPHLPLGPVNHGAG